MRGILAVMTALAGVLVSNASAALPEQCFSGITPQRNGPLIIDEPFLVRGAHARARIFTARADGTHVRALVTTPNALARSNRGSLAPVAVSPDGRWLLYQWLFAPQPFRLINLRTHERHTLPIAFGRDVDVIWTWYSPDVLVVGHKLQDDPPEVVPQFDYFHPDGSRAPAPPDVFAEHPWEWRPLDGQLSWSPNHLCLAGVLRSEPPALTAHTLIRIAPLDGSPPVDIRVPATVKGRRFGSFSLTPDRVRVTTGDAGDFLHQAWLWTFGYDGGDVELFARLRYNSFLSPVASPDGKRVIYGTPSYHHPRYVIRRLPNGKARPLPGRLGKRRPHLVIEDWAPR